MPLEAGRLHVFSDFDGTITAEDTLVFLARRLGGGADHLRESERLLRERRLAPREVIARDVGGIRAPFVEAAALLRAEVAIDPGFAPFARWCAARGIPLTVLSAGFEEIVALYLSPAEFPALEVRANRLRPGSWDCCFRDASPFGHDKTAALREARRRGREVVIVGDGLSDEEPAAVADLVFARQGRSLAAWCRARSIPCVEFASFHDVQRGLAERLEAAG
jgi:HAD superfamily phosphoserine phosphatase-like hydrolase